MPEEGRCKAGRRYARVPTLGSVSWKIAPELTLEGSRIPVAKSPSHHQMPAKSGSGRLLPKTPFGQRSSPEPPCLIRNHEHPSRRRSILTNGRRRFLAPGTSTGVPPMWWSGHKRGNWTALWPTSGRCVIRSELVNAARPGEMYFSLPLAAGLRHFAATRA